MSRNKTVKVMGIDQGLANTGFSILEQPLTGKASVIESGYIATKKDNKRQDEGLPARINTLETYYQNKIDRHQPDYIVTEDLFFGRNGVKEGLYISGIILNLAHKNDIPVLKYPPTEVKEVTTGSGAADKDHIIKAIKMQVNAVPDFPELPDNYSELDKKGQEKAVRFVEKQSHEADAIAIALTGIKMNFRILTKDERTEKTKRKAKEKREETKRLKQLEKDKGSDSQ